MTDLIDLKRAAVGRWGAILEQFGFESSHLTGQHGPCPVCGGSDRFRVLDDFNETGAVFCNQCFHKGNGDGLAAIAWRNGWTFPQTLQSVAEYLRMGTITSYTNGHSRGQSVFPAKQNPPQEKPPANLYTTASDAIASINAGSLVATFDYLDPMGNHYATVCRFEPKTFRPVGKFAGGWGVKAPENRFPYHADTVDPATVVYVTEGEGVADTLQQLGLHATTSMGGAQAGDKTDWSILAGKQVIILPDNDDPGRKYAEALSQQLIAIGCRVKIVTLPNLPPKGDAVQWLDSFGEAAEPSDIVAELDRLAAGTPEQGAASTGLLMRTAGDLVRSFPSLRPAIVEGLLRLGETMNIIAASKFGKSWLMLLLAFCVACGPRKWLGKFWTTRGKVLYVDNELHAETLAHRLPLVAESLGLQPADWAENLVVINLRGELIDLKALSAGLSTLRPGEFSLIILDAWYRFQPVGTDENSNADVMALYNLLDNLAARIGSAFVCVHHSSKGDQSGKAVTDVGSGAGSQSRAADCHLVMRSHQEDNAVVIDAKVRSWKPLQPFCARWNFPAWTLAEDLDPADIRKPNSKKKSSEPADDVDASPFSKEHATRLKVLEAYEVKPDGESESRIAADAGMNTRTFAPIQSSLLRDNLITGCQVKKSRGSWPGFKITNAGIETLRQLRQLRQTAETVGASDCQILTPTDAPLKGGVGSRSVTDDWDSPTVRRPA
ncbi:MAG: AAA family ATPase [Planctomycetes bacterium]|nr:AAA family ATPase [Planctomycetota bacterium]